MEIDKLVFGITEEDVQEYAEEFIGRKLTENEMHFARKGIEAGLDYDIEIVYNTAIQDAVDNCKKEGGMRK